MPENTLYQEAQLVFESYIPQYFQHQLLQLKSIILSTKIVQQLIFFQILLQEVFQ